MALPTTEQEGFKVSGAQVREALTPRTRAILFNSPSNPTGAVYTQREMEELAEVVLEADILVISDDIYDKLVYTGGRPAHMAALSPEIRARTLLVNGVSKSYAMTGWRIGYGLGPEALIKAMDTVQGQSTSNPTSVAQKAAVAALTGPQGCVEAMAQEFDRRRRTMVPRLNGMDGVSCFDPQGAFYTFPRVESFLGRRAGDRVVGSPAELADYLLTEARVAVVAGEPFGSSHHIRLSFALSMGEIESGLNRIEQALGKLE